MRNLYLVAPVNLAFIHLLFRFVKQTGNACAVLRRSLTLDEASKWSHPSDLVSDWIDLVWSKKNAASICHYYDDRQAVSVIEMAWMYTRITWSRCVWYGAASNVSPRWLLWWFTSITIYSSLQCRHCIRHSVDPVILAILRKLCLQLTLLVGLPLSNILVLEYSIEYRVREYWKWKFGFGVFRRQRAIE